MPDHMNKMTYAALVGKYIRMERPALESEIENGAPETIGMECTVAVVVITSAGVEICSDYGYSFLVSPEDEQVWKFHIWPDEKTCKEMRM
jgi:hypothetical protein